MPIIKKSNCRYKYAVVAFLASLLMILPKCSSFITKDQILQIKQYEGEYILLRDASRGDHKLDKGKRVRIKIIAKDDYIKVYAMASDVDVEKGEWILLLYMFPDDFENEKYNPIVFEQKLYQIVQPIRK